MIINGKLVYIVIPRTGSHSLEEYFQNNNIPYFNTIAWDDEDKSFYKKAYDMFNTTNKLSGTALERAPKHASRIYRHTHFPAKFWDNSSYKHCEYFTVVREPVDRFISLWNHVIINNSLLEIGTQNWNDKKVVEYVRNSVWLNKLSKDHHFDYINTIRESKNLPKLDEHSLNMIIGATPLHPQSFFLNTNTPIKKFDISEIDKVTYWLSDKLDMPNISRKIGRENTAKNVTPLVRTSFLEDFIHNEFEKAYVRLF